MKNIKKNIQSIRGMRDLLPKEVYYWRSIEKILKDILITYNYHEICLPIIENTHLFRRAMGGILDIVEKEMYNFIDYHGNQLTLRPEGTAGCVRLGIEHGLLYHKKQKLWYIGPMFRYERPQKGRYRQFYQLGVEIFGYKDPQIEAELILLNNRWWTVLGISAYISLEINSIGSLETRAYYCQVLIEFLENHKHLLDEDCRRHMDGNVLRILDTKNPNIQKLLNNAPIITDYLDSKSKLYFSTFCNLLNQANISYKINPYLVRGLDYYNDIVFEWVTNSLGTQNTICGGGRYDNLVKKLGGHDTPALGCAVGLDRLILLMQSVKQDIFMLGRLYIDIYLMSIGKYAQYISLFLTEEIRNVLPNLRLVTDYSSKNFKKKLNQAYQYKTKFILILYSSNTDIQKILLQDTKTGHQEILKRNEIINKLIAIMNQNVAIKNI